MPTPDATYSGNPADSPRDALRLLVGDTDSDAARYTDAEMDYFLSRAGDDVELASQSIVAQQMVAASATAGTRTIGKTTVTDGRTEAYERALKAAQLTGGSANRGNAVALYVSPRWAIFAVGMDDAPGTNYPGAHDPEAILP